MMKVLAAGKPPPPPASARCCGCRANMGRPATASGTPARRRHADTWGARAAAGGAGWRPGASAGTWSRPARARSLPPAPPPPLPRRAPCCSSRAASARFTLPLSFFSYFLSAFPLSLFHPRPGLLPGRGALAEQLAHPGPGRKQVPPLSASTWKAVVCARSCASAAGSALETRGGEPPSHHSCQRHLCHTPPMSQQPHEPDQEPAGAAQWQCQCPLYSLLHCPGGAIPQQLGQAVWPQRDRLPCLPRQWHGEGPAAGAVPHCRVPWRLPGQYHAGPEGPQSQRPWPP
ncbi:Protocadherin Fat 1 [Manis pentadactyla]|nr:Protocadherin Fat 1 [Manis pentadactyla]